MAVSPKGLRVINRAEMLNLILTHGSITRVKLAELTGLNQSTVSKIVSQLIAEGMVYEASRDDSPIGRKPVNLKINEKYRIYGLIDVALWTTTLAVCDLSGKMLDQQEFKTTVGNAQEFFHHCSKELSRMIAPFSEPLAGVAVTVPSTLNSHRGFIYYNKTLQWKEVDVKEIILRNLDCKVLVENDARAAALAELCFVDHVNQLSNIVYILVCDGIGTGIVIGKQIYYGAHSLNGQFGAEVIKINGHWEDFSEENTWEENASDLGVVNRYCELAGISREHDTEQLMQRIIDLAKSGDEDAIKALKETARYLGVGIANINNGLDPERIVVGGKICQVWELIFPELLDQVRSQTNYQVVPLEELIIPSSLNSATFEGARALILQDLFGGKVGHPRKPYQESMALGGPGLRVLRV
jgi:N-acetylglucosamine repressor